MLLERHHSMYPTDFRYTKTHEWVRVEGKKAKVGISSFAIQELTDLTFLQFDVEVGDELAKGQEFGQVESVKTSSSLYLPVAGKVIAINDKVTDELEKLMKDPYHFGWMIEIELLHPEEVSSLMDAAAYEKAAVSHH